MKKRPADFFPALVEAENPLAASAAPDFVTNYNASYPQTLSWKDRRPIASVFLASSQVKYFTNLEPITLCA